MSERLEARAGVVKLARLLDTDAAALDFLADVPSAELRAFRERATNRLFDASAKAFGRVGAAARLVPANVIATIAQRAFGPLLCARAAGAIDTGKAVDVAGRLPAPFLADVAVELDPRRVADIIGAVPPALVVTVAEQLGERGEHVTMGRFIAYVTDGSIAAAMGVLDDEAMLRTAFVLEDKDRLDNAVGLLPDGRVAGIVRSASDHDLWPEVLDLLEHLGDVAIGRIAAELDPDLLSEIVIEVTREPDTIGTLLRIVNAMEPGPRATVVTLIDEADKDLADALVAAVDEPERFAHLLGEAPPEFVDALERAAARHGHADVLARVRDAS